MDRNDYYGGDSASLNLTQVGIAPSLGSERFVYRVGDRVVQLVGCQPERPSFWTVISSFSFVAGKNPRVHLYQLKGS